MIRCKLSSDYPELEINSVDGFQGREKEVVILSLVRSNINRCVGFLSEYKRLNVAATRCKRHLTIICDSDTVSNDKYCKSLIDHIIQHGDHRTAAGLYQDSKLYSSLK